MEPQPNEVWRTKSGRVVLIVLVPEPWKQLGFIWFDELDRTFNCTQVLAQLETKLDVPLEQFIQKAMNCG